MTNAVIFDWGGVLMRTTDYEPRHHWDRRLNLPVGSVERVVHGSEAWMLAQRGKISSNEYWTIIGERLGLGPAQLSEFRHDFYSGDRLDETLLSLIADLRDRGILIGLLSNNSIELLDLLASQQINNLFDGIIISAQIGIMKPDPGAYQAILERLGATSDQSLFIDDAHENVEGAQAQGMAAIRFEPGMVLLPAILSWLRNSNAASTADFAT